MPELEDVKQEIIDAIPKKLQQKDTLMKRINEELELLETTEGINNQNNLESFYDIWKKHKNQKGDKNEVQSWTAYALGLTSQKPEGDFMVPRRAFARAGFPDIDTDFDDEKRNEVYKYIIEKYGRENVGNIGTHGLLKFRSCIRRLCKALDIAGSFHKGKEAYVTDNEQMVTEILSVFGKSSIIKAKDEEGRTKIIENIDDAIKYCPDFKHYTDQYPEIAEHSRYIQGTFANFSIHAAGVVVSDIPLSEIAPLRTAGKGLLATQYSQEDLESLGLIKFDILAISTLTVIKRTLELIEDNYDIKIDIENLPLDDEKTFELYRKGNLGGVFQCESWPMQQTMRDIGVDSFYDIMAAISLFRPGPMDNIPDYCARKKGEMSIDYFHPSIEKYVKPYLEKTYAIVIYQEQIMQICNALAGFSIADGYVIIKAIGKKKQHLMDKFEKQFVAGCVKNNVPKDVAQQYWTQFIVPFASYGFCLAHAGAYSLLSWQTCYLKAHYTDEFVCSLLTVEIERAHHDKVEAFEREFQRKLDIKILPRDINKCRVNYVIETKKDVSGGIEKTEIRPTLLCKGLGINAAQEIEKKQPFADLRDFAERTDSSLVDARVMAALVEAGFFTNKGIRNKDQLVNKFVMIRKDLKTTAKKGFESVDIFE